MANTQTSSTRSEQASVDTDPGADGYGCNSVSLPTAGARGKVYFYIKSIASGATITLQWKKSADTVWYDYEDYTAVGRHAIDDNASDVAYRAIVKNAAQGTGTSIFGIDW